MIVVWGGADRGVAASLQHRQTAQQPGLSPARIRSGDTAIAKRAMTADGIEAKKHADIPMGALWVGAGTKPQLPDIRESASAAHVYGRRHVAAESMTTVGSAYDFAPERLKSTVDHLFANGLNRIVVHASVHQPFDRPGPGFGLGPYGQWFTRKETWAEQAGAWVSYLARSSEMLSQGRSVADIAYLYGEDGNITQLFEERSPAIPRGYDFDYVNADIVRSELSVRDGRLTTRAGMTYRLLVIDPEVRTMTLATVQALTRLAEAGATIVGAKPLHSPSRADAPEDFMRVVDGLWARPNVLQVDIRTALNSAGIAPDVDYVPQTGASDLLFVHRRTEEADVYFLHSREAKARILEVSFRSSGRTPEIWRADRATIEPVTYRSEGERPVVTLNLEPNDAFFVVFAKPLQQRTLTLAIAPARELQTISGPWLVTFQTGRGAPPSARFAQLRSWTENNEPGIRYFSGTASYVTTFEMPKVSRGDQLILDLGKVANLVEVIVNGKSLGVLWKAPFEINASKQLRAGTNRLEVRVTNLWPNRLIGDKQPGAVPIAFAVHDKFKADSPLLPSGLLGPVKVFTRPRKLSSSG